MEVSPGARIDRYLLVEPLGEGGQGTVWKAMDALDASRVVALKLVSIVQTKPIHLERVRREARALAKLEHPSLVRCHGLFEDFKASVLGLVLELVDGKSLADALDDARFTPALRWVVLQHVAHALAHLHERHIIHRDLKPENIVLAAQFWTTPNDPNTVKIIDFGIAAEEGNPNPLTAYGNVIGTPAYMAPELIDATYFAGGRPTPAIDVFAFGVVAWILLVGGHPTGLSSESTLVDYAMEYRKVVTGERSWATTGGPPFVAQCLEPRPERRLQSGADVIRAMEGGTSAPAPTAVEKPTVAIGGRDATRETAPAPELFRPRVPPTANMSPAPELVPRSKGGGAAGVIVAVVVLAGGAGLIVALLVAWHVLAPDDPPAAAPTTVTPRATVPPKSTAPAAGPVVPTAEQPRIATRPAGCSDGVPLCECCPKACCPSGRDCGGACKDIIPPTEAFNIRLAGIAHRPEGAEKATDLFKAYPGARACFRLTGSSDVRDCTALKDIRGFDAPEEYLQVRARDLTDKGLDIDILDGAEVLARGVAIRTRSPERSAICKGLIVTGAFEGTVQISWVSWFLDDPAEATPKRCVKAKD